MAALAAALVMAFATSGASANRSLEVRGAEGGVAISSSLTFNGTELRPETAVVCPVTLLRTLSRIIPKIEGTLMGSVIGVAIDKPRCTGAEEIVVLSAEGTIARSRELGNGVVLYEVLWNLVYVGFTGNLPEISGIIKYIRETRFRLRIIGVSCLFTGDAYGNVAVSRRTVTGGSADLARTRLRKVSEFFCPFPTGTFSGTFRVPPLTIALL